MCVGNVAAPRLSGTAAPAEHHTAATNGFAAGQFIGGGATKPEAYSHAVCQQTLETSDPTCKIIALISLEL
jgi:hypothetical protein